jgi:hypothetical protein
MAADAPLMAGAPRAARCWRKEIHGGVRRLVATVHPSAVLRADDREGAYQGLVQELKTAARLLL